MSENLFQRVREWDPAAKLIAICGLAITAFVIWASLAEIDEITRGSGRVIPSSQAQLVQPSEPAVISEILVRSGQRVEEGQLLVRLDDTLADSELGRLVAENERLSARANRLNVEAGGAEANCGEGTVCAEERRLREIRVANAGSREASLAAAVEQRRRDYQEAQATVASLEDSRRLAQEQVSMLEPLAAQGIVPQTEFLTAQRELVDVRGRLAAARQASGRASAAINEAQANLRSARLDFRQQALNERSEVATRIAMNEETIRGAEARRDRNELRAPASGIVNDVQINTVGGFVGAGEMIMQVVPIGDRLLVEGRISPRDIGFVSVGDPANVKITAFDFSIFGGLEGEVMEISADSIFDDATQESYYRVIIQTNRSQIEHNGQEFPIVPGMVADVEIITGRRSVLSYLFKPISRGLDVALTER